MLEEPAELPPTLPIFPLSGALLLPRSQLPLNIFEPRYLEMVDDALRSCRLIGMVQPSDEKHGINGLYKIGCAGRICSFQETQDGGYVISLYGVCRFRIEEELPSITQFRRIRANWQSFEQDLEGTDCFGFKRDRFFELLEEYFEQNDLEIDWAILSKTPDERLISALSMICPFEASEKQALLEADNCQKRGDLLMSMLEMAIYSHGHPHQVT